MDLDRGLRDALGELPEQAFLLVSPFLCWLRFQWPRGPWSVQKGCPCWPFLSSVIVCLLFSAKVSDVIDNVAHVYFRACGSCPFLGHK